MNDATLDDAELPPIIPAGEWKVELEFIVIEDLKKESALLIQIWMTIKERGATKLLMG